MKGAILSALRIFLGLLLLLVGLIGNFLPIIPGVLLMSAGVLVLAAEVPAVHRWLERMEKRHPKLKRLMQNVRDRNGRLRINRIAWILIVASLLSAVVGYLFYRAM